MDEKQHNCLDWPIQIEIPIEKLLPELAQFLAYLVEDKVPLDTLPPMVRDYICMIDGYLSLISKRENSNG